MTAVLESPSREDCIVSLEGPFHVPLTGELARKVRPLVREGQRRVVIDLAGVSSMDAGGIGALMREHRRMVAVNGALRIVHAPKRVRELLQVAGVFPLLSDE